MSASGIAWFRYVAHAEIVAYLAAGWTIADEFHGTNHGNYSVLMRWDGPDDPPRQPQKGPHRHGQEADARLHQEADREG